MTRMLLATFVLLTTTASAAYTNATIPWATDLDCTACIRSGFDFCLTGTSTTVADNWDCRQYYQTPEYVMPSGGVPNGFVCSNALKDQMNAIINGCRPFLGDAAHRLNCGSYEVDLNTQSLDTRIINKFAAGTSCTYRVISKCGYPVAVPNTRNVVIEGDFNIAYATYEGLDAADELNGWEFETAMDWSGSYQTGNAADSYKLITDGSQKPMIADLNVCKEKTQNLYITVTRTKVTPNPALAEGDDFLAATPRQLQGGLTPDFEIGFSLTQGNARFIGALSFALAALLAVFAF